MTIQCIDTVNNELKRLTIQTARVRAELEKLRALSKSLEYVAERVAYHGLPCEIRGCPVCGIPARVATSHGTVPVRQPNNVHAGGSRT